MASVIRGSDNFDSGVNPDKLKAWVNFNGQGTVAIRTAFNVGSITDHSTGTYTVNFSTALADANYVAAGMASNGNNMVSIDSDSAVPTASSLRIQNYDASNSPQDTAYVHVLVFR